MGNVLEAGEFYPEPVTFSTAEGVTREFKINYRPEGSRMADLQKMVHGDTIHRGFNMPEEEPSIAIYIRREPQEIYQSLANPEVGPTPHLICEALYRNDFIVKQAPEKNQENDPRATYKLAVQSLLPASLDHKAESKNPEDNTALIEEAISALLSSRNPNGLLPEGFTWTFNFEKNFVEIYSEEGQKNGGGKLRFHIPGFSTNNPPVESITLEIAENEVAIPKEEWGTVVGFIKPERRSENLDQEQAETEARPENLAERMSRVIEDMKNGYVEVIEKLNGVYEKLDEVFKRLTKVESDQINREEVQAIVEEAIENTQALSRQITAENIKAASRQPGVTNNLEQNTNEQISANNEEVSTQNGGERHYTRDSEPVVSLYTITRGLFDRLPIRGAEEVKNEILEIQEKLAQGTISWDEFSELSTRVKNIARQHRLIKPVIPPEPLKERI